MHLLICEKGDSICFSTDWTHNMQPPPEDKQGNETFRGETLTEDLLFPNHWCLLSSILSGT